MEAKTREENAKAYDEWIVQKELRDSALKCLALVPRPVAEMPVLHDDVRGSAASLKKSPSAALGECVVLICVILGYLCRIISFDFHRSVHRLHSDRRYIKIISITLHLY